MSRQPNHINGQSFFQRSSFRSLSKVSAAIFTASFVVGAAGIMMVGLSTSSTASAPSSLPPSRVATVDMQKALQTVELGKKAKAQLEKEFNAKKKDLQTEETAIKKMGEEFKKQSLVMSDEARAKKQNELQERVMKLQEMTGRSQSEIQQKERDLTQPIITKLRGIIADTAKKKEYNLVLERNENFVLYSEDKDDLTSEVVALFDKSDKK